MDNNKKILMDKLELVKLGKLKLEDLNIDTNISFQMTQSI